MSARIVDPARAGTGATGVVYRFLRSIPTWVLWLIVLVWSTPTLGLLVNSVRRIRFGRSPKPVAQTPWRWRFLAIVWCGMTAHCQAIAGASNANAPFSNGRHGHERSSQDRHSHRFGEKCRGVLGPGRRPHR